MPSRVKSTSDGWMRCGNVALGREARRLQPLAQVAQQAQRRLARLGLARRIAEERAEQPRPPLAALGSQGDARERQELAHRVPHQRGVLEPRQQALQLVQGAEEASAAGENLVGGSGGGQRRRGGLELLHPLVQGQGLGVVPEHHQPAALAVHRHQVTLLEGFLRVVQLLATDHVMAGDGRLLLAPLWPPVEQHLRARGGRGPAALDDHRGLLQLQRHQPDVAQDAAARRDDGGGVAQPGRVLGADGAGQQDRPFELGGPPAGGVEEGEAGGPAGRGHGRRHVALARALARDRRGARRLEPPSQRSQLLVRDGRSAIGPCAQVVVGPEGAGQLAHVQLVAPAPGLVPCAPRAVEHASADGQGQSDDPLRVAQDEQPHGPREPSAGGPPGPRTRERSPWCGSGPAARCRAPAPPSALRGPAAGPPSPSTVASRTASCSRWKRSSVHRLDAVRRLAHLASGQRPRRAGAAWSGPGGAGPETRAARAPRPPAHRGRGAPSRSATSPRANPVASASKRSR